MLTPTPAMRAVPRIDMPLTKQLPESLAESRTAELLEDMCDVDLDTLDVELPRGFGRD